MILNFHSINKNNIGQSMSYFENFFKRLNNFQCFGLIALSCVLLKLLFNKNSNYHTNNESRNYINWLNIRPQVHNATEMASLDEICLAFDKCKSLALVDSHLINDDNDNDDGDDVFREMRHIKTLTLNFDDIHDNFDNNGIDDTSIDENLMGQKLLSRFGRLSDSVRLYMIHLTFKSIAELKSIFHCNLRYIYFEKSSIDITIDVNEHKEIGRLEHLEFLLGNVENINHTLINLDKYSIRRNIRVYTVLWSQPFVLMNQRIDLGDHVDIFNKIFFQDYNKHPLLEKIIITFKDDYYYILIKIINNYLLKEKCI